MSCGWRGGENQAFELAFLSKILCGTCRWANCEPSFLCSSRHKVGHGGRSRKVDALWGTGWEKFF